MKYLVGIASLLFLLNIVVVTKAYVTADCADKKANVLMFLKTYGPNMTDIELGQRNTIRAAFENMKMKSCNRNFYVRKYTDWSGL